MASNIDWEQELYGASPTQSKGNSQNPLMVLGNFLAPNTTQALTQGPQQLMQQAAARGNTQGNFLASAKNALADTGDFAKLIFNPKQIAEEASYAYPEAKLMKGGGIASKIVNRSAQGAVQGGLNSYSQGQNPLTGAATGAVVGPAMGGIGGFLTDTLPRYIGFRNFGPAGLKLPEVVKAENAASSAGYDSLKGARQGIMNTIHPFQFGAEAGSKADRQSLLSKISDLAAQPEWVGTPGLSDLKKLGKGSLPQMTGVLSDIKNAVQDATDPFDAYSRLKNMAYATDNSPAANKLASFMRSAAHVAREHLIQSSDNPTQTAKAMDMYAAQTAMNMGKGVGGNKITNMLGQAAKGLGPDALAGIASVLPLGLHGLAPAALVDTALTNPITGPATAKGLVNIGQKVGDSGLGNILTRLGIGGVQAIQHAQ